MRYFFIGIGGVSMSALAKILFSQGHTVCGSDAVASENTQELTEMGIKVWIGHRANNLPEVDRVVINGAIPDNNPELIRARQLGIKIFYREFVLAEIARGYHQVIAVAGCHGKSSTTAMIGEIFQKAGYQPTIHNGAKHNLEIGSKNIFITEACEFRKSFLKLKPTIAVITNVDADHLDCYHDLEDIKFHFGKFASKADIVIKNADDVNSMHLSGRRKTISFGIHHGDVHACNLRRTINGSFVFQVVVNPKCFGAFFDIPFIEMKVPGIHHVANALAAIACALTMKISWTCIKDSLSQYCGIARRFETLGKINNTPVILDYAHHPREIETTIETANTLYQNYLLVFQPHTYTRTVALWPDFVSVLGKIKNLVLYKTYAARGKSIIGGRAIDLSRQLRVPYIATIPTLKKYITMNIEKFDAIILCGAGDVVGGQFLHDEKLLTTD